MADEDQSGRIFPRSTTIYQLGGTIPPVYPYVPMVARKLSGWKARFQIRDPINYMHHFYALIKAKLKVDASGVYG